MARRLHLIANSKSGKGHGQTLKELAEKLCAELGAELLAHDVASPKDLLPKAKEALRMAKGRPNDVIVAAGGDGTIRSVAEAMVNSGTTFAVVPCGTFNFFARANEIPEDHEQALRLAITGQAKPIRLGEINKHIFLINASLGIYAKSIAEREASTKRFGRKRIVVILSTAKTLLKPHRLLTVTMRSKGMQQIVRTPMVFIGNNALQLRNLKLSVAKHVENGHLAIVTLKPVRGWEMLRVLARGVIRTLEKEERLEQFHTEEMHIETKRKHQKVALDGETFDLQSPLEVRSLPDALEMIVPS